MLLSDELLARPAAISTPALHAQRITGLRACYPQYARARVLISCTAPSHQSYAIAVTVRDAYGYNNSDFVLVDVARSELVAAINGGDRTISFSNVVADGLVLDSASYDPDSGDEDGLRFNWSCVVSEGGRPCAAELLPAATTAAFLREAGEYEFILTVSKYSRGSWRSASTSATINVACVL